MAGTQFDHRVYVRKGPSDRGLLHVYLEGDGSPWIGGSRISPDPTAKRAYALELMAKDPSTSAYISRPCYQNLEGRAECSPDLWTHRRYSAEVVDSLEAAIRNLEEAIPSQGTVLIGYSGGGVLAMLLAERLESTRAVITIAANLDVDAWTSLHGYSPLTGSMNPAEREPLRSDIRQLHLAGGLDSRVPPEIVEAAATLQVDPEIRVYESFDHTCCWVDLWPEILDYASVWVD